MPEPIDLTSARRLVILNCPWDHVMLWPDGLLPLPVACMNKITGVEPWPPCGLPLTPRAVVGILATSAHSDHGQPR